MQGGGGEDRKTRRGEGREREMKGGTVKEGRGEKGSKEVEKTPVCILKFSLQ